MTYIDTNVLIYAIENHPKYGKPCKAILEDVQKGRIKAEASLLVLIECINVLNKINKELRKLKEKELNVNEIIMAIESIKINWLDINFLTIERASDYKHNVNPIDYLHISTMELNSITQIISADGGFDKIDWINRIDPLVYK